MLRKTFQPPFSYLFVFLSADFIAIQYCIVTVPILNGKCRMFMFIIIWVSIRFCLHIMIVGITKDIQEQPN